MTLQGKTILITGGAVRIGRHLALAFAQMGADLVIHYGKSDEQAQSLAQAIQDIDRRCWLIQADLNDPEQVESIIPRAAQASNLYALINNASIFEPDGLFETTLDHWNRHLQINLTAPFLLSQAFARALPPHAPGRIVNLLDWRALRPYSDHFAYTISKVGLAGLTKSLAAALAPDITVNGIALGAILAPSDGSDPSNILENVPAGRWAALEEVSQTAAFLLDGPSYITGEIIHLDGGRHLV